MIRYVSSLSGLNSNTKTNRISIQDAYTEGGYPREMRLHFAFLDSMYIPCKQKTVYILTKDTIGLNGIKSVNMHDGNRRKTKLWIVQALEIILPF